MIGAGAVGVEFGSIFKSFGAEVTIVEYLPRVVPVEDEEVCKELTRVFRKRGIESHVGCKVDKIEKTKDGVKVSFDQRGRQAAGEGSGEGAGRRGTRAAHRDVGLEKTKIEARSRIRQRERVDGDRGAGHLRHRRHRGRAAATGARGRDERHRRGVEDRRAAGASGQARPHSGCTYCDPQIGSVGLTEAQAKEKGYEVKVGKFPFAGNSKATIVDAHDGFVKIVSDAKYGEILGVHIIGPQATELIAEAVTAMELEATVEELMFTIHAHPTLSEWLCWTASAPWRAWRSTSNCSLEQQQI